MTKKLPKPIKPKKEKQNFDRTKEERIIEVDKIKNKLIELDINDTFNTIKELYKLMDYYVENGVRVSVNLPFPEYDKTIKGVLSLSKKENCLVKMESNDKSELEYKQKVNKQLGFTK
jgi:hypothetical protein